MRHRGAEATRWWWLSKFGGDAVSGWRKSAKHGLLQDSAVVDWLLLVLTVEGDVMFCSGYVGLLFRRCGVSGVGLSNM